MLKQKAAKSICFVFPASSYFLDGDKYQSHIGGAEVQQYYIGCYLKKRGWRVSFISYDHGQFGPNKYIYKGGIHYYKCSPPGIGIPKLRFLHPQLTSLWKALGLSDASIYYQRSAGFITGICGYYCKLNRKKFIYAASSDTNFIPNNFRLNNLLYVFLYKYGLKNADLVTVQNDRQRALLKRYFAQDSLIVKSALPDNHDENFNKKRWKYFIWVGGIRRVKRPDYFLDLCRAHPKHDFLMICGGAKGDGDYVAAINKRIKSTPNLQCLEQVPHRNIGEYFKDAIALINTSYYEGFPNTFLEAWRAGIPVISFVDPDSVIERNDLGIVVDSKKELFDVVRKTSLNTFFEKGEKCRSYFCKNHVLNVVGSKYDRMLTKLLGY